MKTLDYGRGGKGCQLECLNYLLHGVLLIFRKHIGFAKRKLRLTLAFSKEPVEVTICSYRNIF